jgi:hypothetical protein
MFDGLLRGLRNLKQSGVRTVYLDGSFVTNKTYPGDIDGCWDANPDIDVGKLDSVFLDFSNRRAAMKRKYGLDFFISQGTEGSSGVPFVEFFQTDRDGVRRGIIEIDLSSEVLR